MGVRASTGAGFVMTPALEITRECPALHLASEPRLRTKYQNGTYDLVPGNISDKPVLFNLLQVRAPDTSNELPSMRSSVRVTPRRLSSGGLWPTIIAHSDNATIMLKHKGHIAGNFKILPKVSRVNFVRLLVVLELTVETDRKLVGRP